MGRFALLCTLLVLPALPSPLAAQAAPTLDAPAAVVEGHPFAITIGLEEGAAPTGYTVRSASGAVLSSGTLAAGETEVGDLRVASGADLPLTLVAGAASVTADPFFLAGWTSLLPPLVAILLALILREVIISLFAGVWLGALLWTGLSPFVALQRTIDTFVLPALANEDHAAIIIFSMLIGGMVGLIGRNGGTHGIVERLAPYATSPRRGLLATYAQGLVIFFDDYANTLIVGNTMRPVTDRLRVSREKLAYIVDSTSAPVASIMFVSTWVGYEISLIADGLRAAADGVAAQNPELAQRLSETSAFNVFIDTIPYRFYPLLALVLVLMVIVSGRDFGPMRRAEARAASGRGVHRADAKLLTDTASEAMEPPPGTPVRWWNAVVPVLVVVVTVIAGLYLSGSEALGPGEHTLRDVFGAANSYRVLLWASLLGCITAIVLTLSQRLLSVAAAMEAWMGGMRAMLLAMVILVLAWALQNITEALGTAGYLSSLLQGNVSPELLPVLVFAVAAATSFATGTSWGTMAILLPLVIPLGAALTVESGAAPGGHYTILLGVISSVLAGSIFGDHCSPISDTTVLSSMASGCDLMDHVRTQLPYALLVAVVGMAVGDVPTAYGLSPWISLAVGCVILWAVLRLAGKKGEDSGARLTEREIDAVVPETA